MGETNIEDSTVKEKIYTIKEFFEEVPPGRDAAIENLTQKGKYRENDFLLPEINLYCNNEKCKGFRLFESRQKNDLGINEEKNLFITYRCKNCEQSAKIFAIWTRLNEDENSGLLYKYGEIPEFGPPTPSKVISVLGNEKDYYFKGRRAENQGLGIAAFAYYRRVVENQKNKIFDEIIRTVQKIDPANNALLTDLENAKKETQFTKAVGIIKHGMPQALLINGHNPLTLLHSALSDGLHEKTDNECLEIATSIRIILTDLVDRMANVLKDTAELKTALSRILQRNNPSFTK